MYVIKDTLTFTLQLLLDPLPPPSSRPFKKKKKKNNLLRQFVLPCVHASEAIPWNISLPGAIALKKTDFPCAG